MASCPNLSNPEVQKEFSELKKLFGESNAYFLWDKNKGYHIDKASNGRPSNLFSEILRIPQIKTRDQALRMKSRIYTDNFNKWFKEGVVDENGEPKLLYKLLEEDVDIFEESEAFLYEYPNVQEGEFNIVLPVFSNEKININNTGIQVPSNTVKALFNDGSFNTKDNNVYYNKGEAVNKGSKLNNLDINELLKAVNIPENIQPFLHQVTFELTEFNEKNVRARYYIDENIISLSKNSTTSDLLHELVHAATVQSMLPENRGKLSKDQKQAIDNIEKLWKETTFKKGPLSKLVYDPYGLVDASEMVAEYISNDKFRNYLNELNSTENSNFLQELILAIKRLFNIEDKNDISTLVSDIDILVEATNKINKINKINKNQGYNANSKYRNLEGKVYDGDIELDDRLKQKEPFASFGTKSNVEESVGSKELSSKTDDLKKSLLDFLENNDVVYKRVKSILDEFGKDPLNKEVTAIYGQNVLREGKNVKHIIEMLEGNESTKQLAEEVAHFVVAASKGSPLYDIMMNKITEFGIYDTVKNDYDEFYKGDETLIKEEVIGQLISKIIMKEDLGERTGLDNMAKKWWERMFNFLSTLFKGLTSKGETGFNMNVNPFLEVVDSILEGKTIKKIYSKDTIIMAHITPEMRKEKKILEEMFLKPLIKARDEGGYEVLSTKEIVKNRVSDLVSQNSEAYYRSKDIDFKMDPLPMLKGTYVHAWNEAITHKYNDILKGAKNMDEVTSRLESFFMNIMSDDNMYDAFKSKIDSNTRQSLSLNKEGYLLSDLQSIDKSNVKALFIGMAGLYIDIYTKANNINKSSKGSFENGDVPSILPEVKIYDPSSDLAGTIDLLVIQPNLTIDKYDFKTKQFNVNRKDGTPNKPFNVISQEGFAIQLMNYNHILTSAMGIDPKMLGESRIVPINVIFNKDKALNNIGEGFKLVEMGYFQDKKREYLKTLPVQGERHLDDSFNKNIDLFFKNKEKLLSRRKKAKRFEDQLKIDRELERVETILSKLLVDNDLHYIYRELKGIGKNIKDRLNIPSGEENSLTLGILNSYYEYLLNYDEIYKNSANQLYKLYDKKQKNQYDKIPALLERLNSMIIAKTIDLINQSSEIDVSANSKEISFMKSLVGQANDFSQPYMKRLYELISVAENNALNSVQELHSDIMNYDDAVKKWAKQNGMSKSKAFSLLYNQNSGQLIGKFDKDHIDNLEKARKDLDLKWMESNTNVNSAEFRKDLAEGRKTLEKILNNYGGRKYDSEAIKKELAKFDYKYDPKKNAGAAFRPYNKFIKLKENSKSFSKEWSFVNKKENKPLLDYYNAYTGYNEEFSKLLDTYVSPRNIANIRASVWERVTKYGIKGTVGLNNMVRHSFEVREYEPDSSYVDKTTKQPKKHIPVYFMDTIRQALTNSERKTIIQELQEDPDFTKGSIKYNNELFSRIERAEFEKGNTYKSFDLTRSLILFGESVYTNKFYSEKEDIALGLRNVINTKEINTEILGNQGSSLYNSIKKLATSISGTTSRDLKTYDKFLNYYFYGEHVQNPDKLVSKSIKIEHGVSIKDRRALSTNKFIRYFLNMTAVKALALKPIIASGNAINSISSVYIMASGESKYNKKQVNQTIKQLLKGDKKMLGMVHYVEPSSRNITKEKANKISANFLDRLLTMDNLFFMHKKPDDFTDNIIMGAMANNYGLDANGKLVNIKLAENGKSIWDLAEIDENGDFSIKGLEKDSEAFIKFRERVKKEATRIKGSIPSEAQNLLGTNIYLAAASQFRNWIKGTAEARLNKVHYNETFGEVDGGRMTVAYQQLATKSDILGKLANLGRFGAEITRMGIPFGFGNKIGSMFRSETLNDNAVTHYYNTYLKENNFTKEDITKEEYIDFTISKIKELAKEVSIILRLLGLSALVLGGVPDDKEDPEYLIMRNAAKIMMRGYLEMGFWTDPNSTLGILNNPIPSLRTIEDLVKVVSNTIDVTTDILFQKKNDPYRAVWNKSRKDKKPLFYESSKFVPGVSAGLDIFNFFDKPLVSKY